MNKVRHTFLFEEGYWSVEGEYTGPDGNPVPLAGSAKIVHSEGLWRSQGVMRLTQEGKELDILNDYEIAPFSEGKGFTPWRAENPVLGRLTGLFVVVDDSIISTIASEDGEVSGIEYLLKVSDGMYRSRGFILRGDEILSSWAAELVRAEGSLH